MREINWPQRALRSEITFSKALGGKPIAYPNFIHLHNEAVPWGGDFNRAVGVRIADLQGDEDVEKLTRAAKKMAPAKGLTAIIKDESRCVRCGVCARRCPGEAITMEAFQCEEEWE